MAEDKSKTVIVKERAKAFLTSKPEEEKHISAQQVQDKTVAGNVPTVLKAGQKPMAKASEIAAAIRKKENLASESKKQPDGLIVEEKVKNPVAGQGNLLMIKRKNKLVEGNKVKKIPACKMAEPMKKPADETLIIAGRVTAAGKKIQTPAVPEKTTADKITEIKAEPKKETVQPAVKKAEPKKETVKPAAKKAEPKKEAAKPAAKKADPKKEAAKPAAKKAEPKQNLYIQYQDNTYLQADLIAKAEKIWTGDLKKKASDLKTLELYVKPQEKMVYCVFNKKETGSFAI